MKLGYLMPLTRENIKTAANLGYDALEARIGWLDTPGMCELEDDLDDVRDALAENKVAVTAVAIYGETIEAPFDDAVAYWERAMQAAGALGCDVVCGRTGRDSSLSVDENLPTFVRYFERITEQAQDSGVRLALDPWPGQVLGHGPCRWQNMATSPQLWDRLFEAVPAEVLGLEYDPSHLVWQGIDHLQAIRDYAPRIHHVRATDIVIDQARLGRAGVYGRGWWRFVIPGLGQIDWVRLFEELSAAGYRGDVAVEHKDRAYLERRWSEGLRIALKTLRPLVEAYA
jgi:sugar phosphate isomerase/epimerase